MYASVRDFPNAKGIMLVVNLALKKTVDIRAGNQSFSLKTGKGKKINVGVGNVEVAVFVEGKLQDTQTIQVT